MPSNRDITENDEFEIISDRDAEEAKEGVFDPNRCNNNVERLCCDLKGEKVTLGLPDRRTLTAEKINQYTVDEIREALGKIVQPFFGGIRPPVPAFIEGLRHYARNEQKNMTIIMALFDKAGMDFVRTLIAKHQKLFDTIVVPALCQDEAIELMPTLMHLGQATKGRLFKLTHENTTLGRGVFGIYASFYPPSKNARANARTELIESLYQSNEL